MFRSIIPMLLPLTLVVNLAGTALAAEAKDGERCDGTFEIGGTTYALKYAVAFPVKVFDEDGFGVIFSDQAIPVEKLQKALADGKGSADKFFFFKPHVQVTFDKAGKVMFCNAYADNNSLSVSGGKLSGTLAVKDGRAKGEAALAVDPDSTRKSSFAVKVFDLPVLDVAAPAEKPEQKVNVERAEEPRAAVRQASAHTSPAAGAGKAVGAGAVAARELALPDAAANVEYKKLVGHIRFTCPDDVKAAAAAIDAKLAGQGWTADGAELVTERSAILRRTHGDASLTVFVKPDAARKGSTVLILSKGLAWDDDAERRSSGRGSA
jgi:hypothetical protein